MWVESPYAVNCERCGAHVRTETPEGFPWGWASVLSSSRAIVCPECVNKILRKALKARKKEIALARARRKP